MAQKDVTNGTVAQDMTDAHDNFTELYTWKATIDTEAELKALYNLQIGTDVLAQQTIGIENDNLLEVDGTPNTGEYAKFTANGLEGRTESEFKSDFSLEAGTDFAVPGANGDITSLTALSGSQNIPTINLTGGQIAFPSTAVPSTDPNTIDDYEEGTWTPAVGGNATYITQFGLYTKIGNLVYVDCDIKINVIGSGSVNEISGLPFSSSAEASMSIAYFSDLAESVMSISGIISLLKFTLFGKKTAGVSSESLSVMGNSAKIICSGMYTI